MIVPVPDTRSIVPLKENIGAAEINLGPDDLNEITATLAQIEVQGERYPKAH